MAWSRSSPSQSPTATDLVDARGGGWPSDRRPPSVCNGRGTTVHELRGRNRFPFNDLLNVRRGDLAKGFLGEGHRAAARPGDPDGCQIRVSVAGEPRRARDEIAFDVPLEILRGDLGECRLGCGGTLRW